MAANVNNEESLENICSCLTSLKEELKEWYKACIEQRRDVESRVQQCKKLLKPWPSPMKEKCERDVNTTKEAAQVGVATKDEADIELLDKILAKAQKAREIQNKLDLLNPSSETRKPNKSNQSDSQQSKPETGAIKKSIVKTTTRSGEKSLQNKKSNPVTMATKPQPTTSKTVVKQPVLQRKTKPAAMKTTYGAAYGKTVINHPSTGSRAQTAKGVTSGMIARDKQVVPDPKEMVKNVKDNPTRLNNKPIESEANSEHRDTSTEPTKLTAQENTTDEVPPNDADFVERAKSEQTRISTELKQINSRKQELLKQEENKVKLVCSMDGNKNGTGNISDEKSSFLLEDDGHTLALPASFRKLKSSHVKLVAKLCVDPEIADYSDTFVNRLESQFDFNQASHDLVKCRYNALVQGQRDLLVYADWIIKSSFIVTSDCPFSWQNVYKCYRHWQILLGKFRDLQKKTHELIAAVVVRWFAKIYIHSTLVDEQMDILTQDSYGSSFGRDLNRIRQERRFCDVTLLVEGKQFHAHQIILSARSKYFYGVFTNDMLEKRSQTVSLGELSASAMESLLEYMYTGDVEVNESNAEDLVIAGNYLLLPRLKLLAGKFLEREMMASNCIFYYKFAEQYNCKELKYYSSQMIKSNFGTIGHSKDFMKLGVKNLEELVSGDDIVVRSEEEIFEAILKWIYDDPERREEYFPMLFCHVRVTSMSQSYLFSSLATNALVKHNPDCLGRILEANKTLLIGDGLLLQKPRKCLESHVDAIITCGGLSPDTLVRDTTYCYIPSESTWYELAPMKVKRCRHGLAACCGFLYAIGGKDEAFHKSVERYDPRTNSWTSVAPLARCVKLVGTATLNACIYVVGGIEFTAEEGRRRCDVVQKYDPTTNTWSLVATLSSSRSSVCCVSDERYVYSIGGLGDEGFLDSLERYDPKLNTWMHLAPMEEKRGCACGIYLRGKIYIFGGTVDAFSRQSKCSCELYDVTIDQWSSIPSMRIPRFHAGAVLLRDCVYVLGGIGTDNLNHEGNRVVECYSINTNKWLKEHSIPYEETYLRCSPVSLYKGLVKTLPKLGSRASIITT